MTFITQQPGTVSIGNSSVLSLPVGGSFIGTFENVVAYAEVTVLVVLNFAAGQSAQVVLYFSTDGSIGNAVQVKEFFVKSANDAAHTMVVPGQYFQVQLLANLGTAANGAIQTIYHTGKSIGISTTVADQITENTDVSIARSVLTGQTAGGIFNNVGVLHADTFNYALEHAIRYPVSAFGDVRTQIPTPLVQATTMYDIIQPQVWMTERSGTQTVTSSGMVWSVVNGLNNGDYIHFVTVADAHYHPGQGMLVRFTALFPNGDLAGVKQLAGFGNVGNGFFFGYNDTGQGFGICHRQNQLAQVMQLTITTAATASGTATVTLPGFISPTTVTIPLTNAGGNIQFTAYQIATQASYPTWYVRNIGNTVEFVYNHAGGLVGTASFSPGTSGAAANFSVITTGIAPVDTFIPQSIWNIDPMNGTGPSGSILDPSKGNVYQICYQWLGFGDIVLFIEAQSSGIIQAVHHIAYANSNTIPSMQIPHGACRYFVENYNATATIGLVKGSSTAAFIEGESRIIGMVPSFSIGNTKNTASTPTETVIISIANRDQFNGYTNQTDTILTSLTVSSTGGAAVIVRLYQNPSSIGGNTTTNFVDWIPVDRYSSVVYDTTATTVSGGQLVYQVTNTAGSSTVIDISSLALKFYRRQVLVVTAAAQSGGQTGTPVTVSLTWQEDN
ncbi:MAG: hypothetical protein ACYCOU_06595 [Sulfobacillus sp.]